MTTEGDKRTVETVAFSGATGLDRDVQIGVELTSWRQFLLGCRGSPSGGEQTRAPVTMPPKPVLRCD